MLKIINLNEDLITATVDEILKENKEDFSNLIVIFPSKRMRLFLQEKLSQKIGKNYFPPHMLTIDNFFNYLFELNFPGFKYANELEASIFLFLAVKEVFKGSVCYGGEIDNSYIDFFPNILNILNAVEEILVEGGKIEKLNGDIFKEFVRYGEYHKEYKNFIIELPQLIKRFLSLLVENKKYTRGFVYKSIAQLCEDEKLKIPGKKKFIFVGMNALNVSEEKLLKFSLINKDSLFILRSDSSAVKESSSPFFLQYKTLKALNLKHSIKKNEFTAWNRFSNKVNLYPESNVETEMLQVYEILANIIKTKKSKDDLKKIGIVLPDSSSLIPFIQGVVSRFDMKDDKIPFNITMGYPFVRTPLFQLIHNILKVAETYQNGRLFSIDYLNLIRHPYVKLSGDLNDDQEPLKRGIHLIEYIINKENILYFDIDEIEEKLSMVLESSDDIDKNIRENIKKEIFRIHRTFIIHNNMSLDELCVFIKNCVLSLEKNKEVYLFLEEYIFCAVEVMDELIDFSDFWKGELGSSNFNSLSSFIRFYFSKKRINFQGSPLKGIQVMGMLEFRGLKFDDVIILDVVEGVLPKSSKYDAFLPYDIRKVLGIRAYSDWEKLYSFNFFSLIGSSKNTHVLWTEKKQGFGRTEKSRFVERIIYEIEKEKEKCNNIISKRISFNIKDYEKKVVEKNIEIERKLREIEFSPSSLETYVKCPLRFYFEKVLNIKEKEEISLDADSGTLGTIIHKSLEQFYKSYKAQSIENNLEQILEIILKENFKKKGFKKFSGVWKIRFLVLFNKIKDFILFDLNRMREGNIEISGLEKQLSQKIFIDELKRDIFIKGRIDRIEKQNNIVRIIDYKTGADFHVKVNKKIRDFNVGSLYRCPKDEYIDKLNSISKNYRNFQILLYLKIYNENYIKNYENMDAAYIFLKMADKFFKPVFISANGNEPISNEDKICIMHNFSINLSEIIMDIFLREEFIPNSSDKNFCSYCPFKIPCGNI